MVAHVNEVYDQPRVSPVSGMVDNFSQPLADEGGDAIARVRMVEIPSQYATHDTSNELLPLQFSTGELSATRFRS